MPPSERRLQKAIENPKNIRFGDLCRIYTDHGFTIRTGGKQSHRVATLPGTGIKRTFARPSKGPFVKPFYVRDALGAIEEAKVLELLRED